MQKRTFSYAEKVVIKEGGLVYDKSHNPLKGDCVTPLEGSIYYFSHSFKVGNDDITGLFLDNPMSGKQGIKIVYSYSSNVISLNSKEGDEDLDREDREEDKKILNNKEKVEFLEVIKPDYYKFDIKGIEIDVFDIAKAMNLPNTLFNALKYMRVKGGKDKRINDLNKLIECVQREIKYLEDEH